MQKLKSQHTEQFKNTKNIYTLYKIFNKLFSYFMKEVYRTIFILGQRGVGKSYYAFYRAFYKAIFNNEPFALVVENKGIVDKLSANNGLKFLTRLINGWSTGETKKEKRLTRIIRDCGLELKGGTFFIGKRQIGFILSYNDFANDKGSNMVVKRVIVDEFIPVKLTFMNRDIDEKVASVIESIGRDDIKELIFIANPIRLNNPLMVKFGFQNIKPGQTLIKRSLVDNNKINAVCHYIDSKKFKNFTNYKENTASGEFAIITGNTGGLYGHQDNIDFKQKYVPKPRVEPFLFVNLGAYLVFYNYKDKDNKYTVTVHLTQERSKGLVKCQLTTPYKKASNNKCFYDNTLSTRLLNIWQHDRTNFTSESAYLALYDFIKGVR